MQPPGGDADLGAEPEFAAIGELGRGVDHHDRAVDFGEEALGGGGVAGDDRIGVVRGMALDMVERRVEPVDHRDRQHRVEIFGVPVVGAGDPDPRIERARAFVAAHFAAGIEDRADHGSAIGEVRCRAAGSPSPRRSRCGASSR